MNPSRSSPAPTAAEPVPGVKWMTPPSLPSEATTAAQASSSPIPSLDTVADPSGATEKSTLLLTSDINSGIACDIPS